MLFCFHPPKHRSSMPLTTPMHVVVASVLASILPITSVLASYSPSSSSSSASSSSLLSFTGDLAPSLLPITLVMLVAAAAGTRGVADAANYSASQLQAMMLPGSRGAASSYNSAGDLYARLGLSNGPSPRHLNADTLRTRLGADFNAAWMSIEAPSAATRAGPANVAPTDADNELVEDLRAMGFSYTDEHGDRRTMPSAVRSIVERWLLQKASCQVLYTWEDMGVLFWPRWVKHGHCDTEAPCSWPPGMHCAAAESDTLRLLHWQCRRADSNPKVRRGGGGNGRRVTTGESAAAGSGGVTPPRSDEAKTKRSGKMHCQWKKVPYPVTSECFCSC